MSRLRRLSRGNLAGRALGEARTGALVVDLRAAADEVVAADAQAVDRRRLRPQLGRLGPRRLPGVAVEQSVPVVQSGIRPAVSELGRGTMRQGAIGLGAIRLGAMRLDAFGLTRCEDVRERGAIGLRRRRIGSGVSPSAATIARRARKTPGATKISPSGASCSSGDCRGPSPSVCVSAAGRISHAHAGPYSVSSARKPLTSRARRISKHMSTRCTEDTKPIATRTSP